MFLDDGWHHDKQIFTTENPVLCYRTQLAGHKIWDALPGVVWQSS